MIACTSPAGSSRLRPLRIGLSSTETCRLLIDSISKLSGRKLETAGAGASDALVGEVLGHHQQSVLDALHQGLLAGGRAGDGGALVGRTDRGLATLEVGGQLEVRMLEGDGVAGTVGGHALVW